MLSQQIRRKFLQYFKDQQHSILPSSSIVPHDDPTLLFTNAGMNQFKDVFLGKSSREYSRAATSQKCIRVGGKHNDLDNVGHTSRHLTFFEMLGNFSFGDYFKKESIRFAWHVSTTVFELTPEKIWVTVFQEDDEAFELWKQILPENRIVRMGEKDNFWSMGDTGPCGPCSELYYDRGPKYGNASSILQDTSGERFLEFWNLVFMQFNRNISGSLSPLPKHSIDTGSGLERIVALKMGVDNLFATDILRSLIEQIEHVCRCPYKFDDPLKAPAFNVIADHIRSLTFAIADGAQPSNVDRGYVLRKLIRRAVRHGRILGMQEPFLALILPRLIEVMGEDYPELKSSQKHIEEVLTLEEESFLRTLKRGGNILTSVILAADQRSSKEISGEEAFKLKDTYGFPLEEILLIAKDAHLFVNLQTYQLLEKQAKEKSKIAHVNESQEVEKNIYQQLSEHMRPTHFMGYNGIHCTAVIQAFLVDGQSVSTLRAGQKGIILLDQTPFYPEKGGQVGDTGSISTAYARVTVIDCKAPFPGAIAHHVQCEEGSINVGDVVEAQVQVSRRHHIQNNHTATHLLHWALIQVLGEHIRQAGSLVEADRFRFDFNHHKSLSKEEIEHVEKLVNEKICANLSVKSYELSYEDAQKKTEIKQFFGDKYGSKVRVIDIGFSKELCGGTHTSLTGNIGYFRIAKESSIAAGVRRIEGLTAEAADGLVRQQVKDLQSQLTVQASEIKALQSQLKSARRTVIHELAGTLIKKAKEGSPAPFLSAIVTVESDELTPLSEEIATQMQSGIIALAIQMKDRCQVILRLTPDLIQKGWNASKILKDVAPLINGTGGGRPEVAQAGGKSPEHIEKLFMKIRQIIHGL